jgi:hypothetical protein
MMKIRMSFDGRRVFLVALVLGVLVSLPTLRSGLFLDDYQQRIALLSGRAGNAFEFFHRGTAITEAQFQNGVLPWWTHPDTKVVFYRPVAQWLMQLDYRLWPDSLALMHLHSVFWYGLLVLVAGWTYRRMMPTRWAAGLAAILFAVDAAHGPAVAWLANRNVMVGMAGALLALLCYRRRQVYWQIAGCALFAFSLACSEGALAITGYFLAYEVYLSDERWRQRIVRLLPYALIAVAWLGFWKHGGFGTSGPGFYIDPAADPSLFLAKMIYRFPAYLVGQFFLPPAELFIGTEESGMRLYALAYTLVVVALLAALLMPLLRSSRVARFYGLGMLIAVIPICGSAPVSRSLWFVGFGAMGLLALFIEQFRSLSMSPARLRYSSIFAGTMMVLHLWLSPVGFVAYSRVGDIGDALMDSHRVRLPDDGAPGKKILAISSLDYVGNVTFPLLKDQALSLGAAPARAAPSIARIRALTEGEGQFELLHKDADTLVVSSPAGLYTLRPSRYGFAAGDRVALDDVDVVVQAVSPEKAPTVIEYRFHPGVLNTYEVIAWQGDHFESAALPAIGATVNIKTGKS